MTPLRTALAALTLAAATFATPAFADAPKADVAGSADHPVLKRFTGSVLVGYAQQDWAQTRFPDASGVSKTENDKFARPITLEGKVTRLFYLSPLGKSPLEIFRNHQQALVAAGFKTVWQCENEAQGCAKAYFALDDGTRAKGMSWAEGDVPGATGDSRTSAWPLAMSITHDEGRMLVGTLSQGGRTLHLLLYTSMAANEYTRRAATYLEIVEPKAMPTGQVTVDAKAIGQGLQAEGKVALYGLFFDTGKTDIKPDSNAQLDQMAATLKAQPGLKVLIVGHTDNVGAIDANLALSEGRAKAVVAALTQRGIAAGRLQARGVANFAPVASNTAEDGRAKNRRVEMVLQ